MNNSRFRSALPAVTAVVLVTSLSGCGTADKTATTTTPQNQSTATTASDPSQIGTRTTAPAALLTTDELGRQLKEVTIGDAPGALRLTTTGNGPYAAQPPVEVLPPVCASVVFTGSDIVFGNTQFTTMKTETFQLTLADAMATTGTFLVEQTAAVFPTAADAENIFDTQKRQWQSCKDRKSVADPAIPENVHVLGTPLGVKEFVLGAVDDQSSGSRKRITISMASYGGIAIPIACQQAMGVQGNLVVEARTCTRPEIPDPGPPAGTAQFPPQQQPNPAWAVPNAQRLVDAMLEKAG